MLILQVSACVILYLILLMQKMQNTINMRLHWVRRVEFEMGLSERETEIKENLGLLVQFLDINVLRPI